jgi:hypothetical protein
VVQTSLPHLLSGYVSRFLASLCEQLEDAFLYCSAGVTTLGSKKDFSSVVLLTFAELITRRKRREAAAAAATVAKEMAPQQGYQVTPSRKLASLPFGVAGMKTDKNSSSKSSSRGGS